MPVLFAVISALENTRLNPSFSFQCLSSAQQGCPTYPKFCWVRTYNIFVIKCRTCALLFFSPFWIIVTVFTVARFHWWNLFLSTGLSIFLLFLAFIALLNHLLDMLCYILMCHRNPPRTYYIHFWRIEENALFVSTLV